jgi:uncharacterized tellurite resistance protein B-like protein
MHSEKLEKLIEMALSDGILTPDEKKMLIREAEFEGLNIEQFEKLLDSLAFIRQLSNNSDEIAISESLEKLIEIALMDNELSDGEMQMLLKEAEAEGIDKQKFEQAIQSMLYVKKQKELSTRSGAFNITEDLIKQTVSHLAKDGGYTENRVRIVLNNAQYIEETMGIDACTNDVKIAENMLALSNVKADSWLVQGRIQVILGASRKLLALPAPANTDTNAGNSSDNSNLESEEDKGEVGIMMKALNFAYEKALNGLPGMDSAEELAKDFLKEKGTLKEQVNALIRWQNAKSAAGGFLTGLGGVVTMPVTIPLNIASVMVVQLRMIAAIAYMGGYDIKDDKVRTLGFICVSGNAATDILKDLGIVIGMEMGKKFVADFIEGKVAKVALDKIIKLVGEKVVQGQLKDKLSKVIPLIGGLIGGTFDILTTNTIGNTARNVFIGNSKNDGDYTSTSQATGGTTINHNSGVAESSKIYLDAVARQVKK